MLQSDSLLIVGASGRAAAMSARRANLKTQVVDLFADQDTAEIAICHRADPQHYPQSLLDIAQSLAPSETIYTGGLENHPDLLEDLSQHHHLLGNSATVCRATRNMEQLHQTLQRHGFHFPETQSQPPSEDCNQWLIKSAGSGGMGVRNSSPTQNQTGYFQKIQPGVAISAQYLSNRQQTFHLGTTRQITEPIRERPYCYGGNATDLAPFSDATIAELARLGNVLREEFQLIGLWGVDALWDNDELTILEVNPRYTAAIEVLEMTHSTAYLGLHCQACFNPDEQLVIPVRSEQPMVVIKRVVYQCQEPQIRIPLDLRTMKIDAKLNILDVPNIGDTIGFGEPVCTLLTAGLSKTECETRIGLGISTLISSFRHWATRSQQ